MPVVTAGVAANGKVANGGDDLSLAKLMINSTARGVK
jgi:hypothetical protein